MSVPAGTIAVMSADEILDALDPDQRAVAQALRGPVCVLAGAGTGKTRALTHRIAYGVRSGVYTPTTVLAVTFTARAAGEMRTRLRDLGVAGVQARTFHAAALRQLSFFWPKVVGGAPPRILEHKAPAVADTAGWLSL
jgi:DNA helicase II / ATP-dependent DNA helicase PcrA